MGCLISAVGEGKEWGNNRPSFFLFNLDPDPLSFFLLSFLYLFTPALSSAPALSLSCRNTKQIQTKISLLLSIVKNKHTQKGGGGGKQSF